MADPTSPSLQFPRSSGLMSDKVRDHDWAATPLGPIADWPVALRLTVDMMLASHFPKCLVWGPRLITIHNDAFLPILGAKPPALGRPFSDVWREAWDVIGPIARRALAGEATFIEDLPLTIHRNGYDELAHFTFCYSPVRDERGAVVGLMDTVIETTGKHVAQKDLRALAASLEQQVAERTADRNRLWQLSGDVLLVTRRDGTIVSANPAWTSILGWTQEQTEGQPLERFVHPLDALRLQTEVIDPQEPLARREASLRFIHRDGHESWIAWAAVSGDGFIHFVGRDVTRERANFQALALAEEQLRQSQKMDAIGQLTGGIAHDFNNMLQGIVLPLQLIGKRVAQGQLDEVPRYADAALAAAKRAAALTQRLLAFSRRQPLDSRPADLAASLRSLEPMLVNTCGENLALQFDLQDGLWPAFTDVHQFESAVLNLAINARDAMPQGGRLSVLARNVPAHEAERVTALAPGDYVCVSVCDTGQGMSPAVQERAFDSFFTTKPLGQGTGLGLSMIYGYLRQSGGVATLDSAEGEGTRVSLYFPRSHADPQDDTPQPLANTASPRRPFSTLVVEDDTTVRTFAVELLRDMGFHVMAASTGNEAMALLSGAIHFDLLVSDVGLPGPNGRQVADYARERLPAIKVLLMTGYAEQAAMNASFLGTQMELLVKPFDAQALVSKVHSMVGLAPPETAAR